MNNQFTGPDAWEKYISALEAETPVIETLGVTDYYVTETYEQVLEYKNSGRLPSVKLIFPNIEMRLDIATKGGGFINLHLLVSPEDRNHISELNRILARLNFTVEGDKFSCTREDLFRFGKRENPEIKNDVEALRHGVLQYKVNFDNLRGVLNESEWAKNNILVAVAGSSTDGTSGVRGEADKALRKKIENFADIIFASSPAQRKFWLGEGTLNPEEICEQYRGLKPCLHGSDAHRLQDVAAPFGNRYCWIKGDPEFSSLWQACIEPRGRAYVGPERPSSATPSQVISGIEVANAPWLQTRTIPLNSGLVAIIGARGSGKTALADMIAAGCDAIPAEVWNSEEGSNPSFLVRAKPLIEEGKVEVFWAAGELAVRSLDSSDAYDPMNYPRVRYLSQKFVENLCSSNGVTDELLQEIERVIFESHPDRSESGALNFTELLEHYASRYRFACQRASEAVSQLSERISSEIEKEAQIESLKSQISQNKNLIKAYTGDRSKLVPQDNAERARRHAEIAEALDACKDKLRTFNAKRQDLLMLKDEVNDFRTNKAQENLRQMRVNHSDSGISDSHWGAFLLDYKGDVDADLSGYIQLVNDDIEQLRVPPPLSDEPNVPFFPDDVNLAELSQALLTAEMERLAKLISADRATQERYSMLSKLISDQTAELQTLTVKLADCEGARARARQLQDERASAYGRAFNALIEEQGVLERLYHPLMAKLAASTGTLKKLSFYVVRTADVEAWASFAEDKLIDLRKGGEFRGRGTLFQKANEELKLAWETGTADEVVAAMKKFRDNHQGELLKHSPMAHSEQAKYRTWLKQFAQWLYSTDHVSIKYGIKYDGVDVQKLSPGTRGIVLLLLYLALDDSDVRPLVIDQPEENLDPKSVFDELVSLFVAAKSNRQIIMVTHNANLVVNTDADQIIIAESGPSASGQLPKISYKSGGLENAEIRKSVCDILEGGERAFEERARRLRIRPLR